MIAPPFASYPKLKHLALLIVPSLLWQISEVVKILLGALLI